MTAIIWKKIWNPHYFVMRITWSSQRWSATDKIILHITKTAQHKHVKNIRNFITLEELKNETSVGQIFYITWSTCLDLKKSVSIIRSRTGLFCITVEPHIVMSHMLVPWINCWKDIISSTLKHNNVVPTSSRGRTRQVVHRLYCKFHKTWRHARMMYMPRASRASPLGKGEALKWRNTSKRIQLFVLCIVNSISSLWSPGLKVASNWKGTPA
jgi:hypothetical protein